MTHDELLKDIDEAIYDYDHKWDNASPYLNALRAVVELHKPEFMVTQSYCVACSINLETVTYPCATIQAIEKELA
jgi:hypothetical protein